MEHKLFELIEKYFTLTDEEKNAIIQLSLFKSYKKGTILLKAGVISNDGYFVLKGCIRCYKIIDGEEKTTAFYTEGESLTPASYVTRTPSDIYISYVEDCMLSVATPEMEKEVFEKFPRFESLCRIFTEELLVKKQAEFVDFVDSTPEQRYLHILRTRPDLLQRVPQYQIASYLGIKPESLSRIRKRISK